MDDDYQKIFLAWNWLTTLTEFRKLKENCNVAQGQDQPVADSNDQVLRESSNNELGPCSVVPVPATNPSAANPPTSSFVPCLSSASLVDVETKTKTLQASLQEVQQLFIHPSNQSADDGLHSDLSEKLLAAERERSDLRVSIQQLCTRIDCLENDRARVGQLEAEITYFRQTNDFLQNHCKLQEDRLSKQENEIQCLRQFMNSYLAEQQRNPAGAQAQNQENALRGKAPTDVEEAAVTASWLGHVREPPDARKEYLKQFPVIEVESHLLQNGGPDFGRLFLSTVIGGASQGLIITVARKRPLSQSLNIDGYLCPNLLHNPWCPIVPGTSGYMFVGLGRDKDAFSEPVIRDVFVGVGAKKSRYMGRYEAVTIEPLTKEEWTTLAPAVQEMYSQTTQKKNKDPRPVPQIRAAYDSGELRVPCVLLRCIGFNHELLEKMVEAKNAPPLPTSLSDAAPGKRKRAGESISESASPRRKSTRGGAHVSANM